VIKLGHIGTLEGQQMALVTRTAKHWHEAGQTARNLTRELEEAKVRLNLPCAQILPMRTHVLGRAVVVLVPIDCSGCPNPTSAEVALLLAIS
jgi:hypothetical protein